MADGLFSDPGHHRLHGRARRRSIVVESLGSARLLRASLRPRVVVADPQDDWGTRDGRRARAGHSRYDLRLRVEPPEHLRHAGLFWSLPFQLRIIAKESLAKFPVLGWHLRRGRHLFVDRRHPDRAGILARWRSLVSEGLSLLIFAEGTRSPDGHMARFKGGSFLLAIEAGLPVVPIAVIGTRQVMPKSRLRTEPADVMLIVHDPIPAPAIERPTARDAKRFADRVHAIVAHTVESRQFGTSHPLPSASNPHRCTKHVARTACT